MRALITGITGFVGGHLAEHLLALGWEVWGQSRHAEATVEPVTARIQLRQADLADPLAVATLLRESAPEIIFHLAGQAYVPQSFSDPLGTIHANTAGLVHLCQAMLELANKPRLLAVGTGEEYGLVQPDDLPISERTPLRPASPYGVSKVAQSLLAQQYALSRQLDVLVVRAFTHIGPRQSARYVSAAFARQIALIEAGLQAPLIEVGNLSAQRDFTDVRDVVRSYALLAEHGQRGEIYNVGQGRAVSIEYLLQQLLALSHVQVEVRQTPALMRPVDLPIITCDPRKLHAATGWTPTFTLAETLAAILADWRARVAAGEHAIR